MKYFKKIKNSIVVELLQDPIVANHDGLTEIEKVEFDTLLFEKNNPPKTAVDLINDIKNSFNKNEPLTLTVDLFNNTTKEITFDCNANSGVLLNSTIDLATRLLEDRVKIWDINDIVYEFTFDEAGMIRDTIAKTYLDRILERQELIAAVV